MIALIGLGTATWLLASALTLRLSILRRFQLPPALVAGMMLLGLGPQGLALLPDAPFDSWKTWPGVLIAFLFSGIILEPGTSSSESRSRPVLAQALYVWMIAFLQLALGYGVCAVFALPEDRLFASVIEISWLGGPGSAAAFMPVAERLGNAAAGQIAVAAATIGLIWGSVSGIPLAAYHRRREQHQRGQQPALPTNRGHRIPTTSRESATFTQSGAESGTNGPSLALLPSFLIPVLPVFLAWMLREILAALVGTAAGVLSGGGGESRGSSALSAQAVSDLPLFFLVIPAAYLIRPLLPRSLHAEGVRLFHQLSLEAIILSAVATISVSILAEHGGMLALLCAGGAVLSLACHAWLSPRLLPHHPELSLINYGMATGTTALGLTLLRTYTTRPDPRSLEIYGLAAPLSAPFIGGGMLSLLLFPEIAVRHSPVLLLAFALLGAVVTGGIAGLLAQTAIRRPEHPTQSPRARAGQRNP